MSVLDFARGEEFQYVNVLVLTDVNYDARAVGYENKNDKRNACE